MEHCPMGNMIGDHFTNPLQLSLFRKSHEEIQGILDDMGGLDLCCGETGEPVIPIPQKCVGRNGKYMGTRPCSNGVNLWDTGLFSIRSNIWVILRI